MSNQTPTLLLPYIQPSQAQKHVTHNEALHMLDVIVQLSVPVMPLQAPPSSPAEGDHFIVGTGATGAWAGHDNSVALFDQSNWVFITARAGWRAGVVANSSILFFDGSNWISPAESDFQNIDGVGIATTSDNTNRLAVSSDATLFSHAGAGHQLKLNKSTVTDTASLLFQDNWSGRAEVGLAGDDDLQLKISADGSAWRAALTVNSDAGAAKLQIGEHDTTADKLIFRTSINGSNGTYAIGKTSGLNRLTFEKPTSDTNVADGSYYSFQDVGCLNAGNPTWQSLKCFGPRVTEAGINRFPAFSQYWSATNRDDPTDLKYMFNVDNVGGLDAGITFKTPNGGDITFKPGPSGGRAIFDAPVTLRSYTVATAPNAGLSGAAALIYVSNETGGAVLAFSDGTNWRRVTDRASIS